MRHQPADHALFRLLFWRRVRWHALAYFIPLLLLAAFFHLQYLHLARQAGQTYFWGAPASAVLYSAPFFLLMGLIILVRARFAAARELEAIRHKEALSGKLIQAAKLASVGKLAAGIAHEINNPLAIIGEEAGMLQDSLDPALHLEDEEELDMAEHLEAIQAAVFRCSEITRKLLTFVRQSEVTLRTVQLNVLLEEVLDGMLAREIHGAGVHVERRLDPTLPPLLTDRTQLGQVLVNLIRNAVDAMTGGGTLTAHTELKQDGKLAISIGDTGCGMTPEQLEKATIPFFTTKEPGQGTGLGLSVSTSIINSFGGELYVQSAPGQGSTFTVMLPARVEA